MEKEEGSEDKMLPIRDKSNIFDSKQQGDEIYVRDISSIKTRTTSNNKTDDKKTTTIIKGETDENIKMGEHCVNRSRIESIHPPLGQLLRICPTGSIAWTKCKFVHPHNSSEGCSNNEPMFKMPEGDGINESRTAHMHKGSRKSPMVVEIISNETDRHRIATFLRLEFDKEPNLSYYLDEICEFDFTHIIIIGRFQYGPIFLDCYGRVFRMDSMSGVLWFIGNSLEEAAMDRWSQLMAWFVEDDGSIYEFDYYSETKHDNDFEDQKDLKVEKARRKVQKNKGKGKKKKSKKNSTIF